MAGDGEAGMIDEDATEDANMMGQIGRRVIALCSMRRSWGYGRIAEKLDVSYHEVRSAGATLQAMGLATVTPVRLGREFNGSAIFLTERGERVRAAIERGAVRIAL